MSEQNTNSENEKDKDEPKYDGLTAAQFWAREKDCLEIAAPGNQTPEKQAEIHARLMKQAQDRKENNQKTQQEKDKKPLPWDDKDGKFEDFQFDTFGSSNCGCGHDHDEDHGHLDDSHDD